VLYEACVGKGEKALLMNCIVLSVIPSHRVCIKCVFAFFIIHLPLVRGSMFLVRH
jgi:hypothetical protein